MKTLTGTLLLSALMCHVERVDAVVVGNAAQLRDAVASANAGGDALIELEDGIYTLDAMLWIAADGVTVRGRSGNRRAVVIEGRGMGGYVTHVFNVAGSNFTVRDLTLRKVSQHAVQLQVDVDFATISNVHVLDTGEQMIKVAYDPSDMSRSSDNGVVENCLLEYSAGIGPQWYIGGVDAHNAKDWIVRDNTFKGIRSPAGDVAEHAIHFWSDSENTLVERNTIINCDRGIGFGLGDRGHRGGIVRNNMVYHDRSGGFADVGLSLESAVNVQVYGNTIFQEHGYPNAIEYRFGTTRGVLMANNLTNRAITSRDGASASVSHNVVNASSDWFVDPPSGNLHLGSAVPQVVDQGMPIPGLTSDFDGQPRPQGAGVDIGADEFGDGIQPPSPDIKANGSDSGVETTSTGSLRITIALDPGGLSGQGADWWIAAATPFGWFHYDLVREQWSPGLSAGYQGYPAAMGPDVIFDGSGLPAGPYTLYFGIDMEMNGLVDSDLLYLDSVDVNVATSPRLR